MRMSSNPRGPHWHTPRGPISRARPIASRRALHVNPRSDRKTPFQWMTRMSGNLYLPYKCDNIIVQGGEKRKNRKYEVVRQLRSLAIPPSCAKSWYNISIIVTIVVWPVGWLGHMANNRLNFNELLY